MLLFQGEQQQALYLPMSLLPLKSAAPNATNEGLTFQDLSAGLDRLTRLGASFISAGLSLANITLEPGLSNIQNAMTSCFRPEVERDDNFTLSDISISTQPEQSDNPHNICQESTKRLNNINQQLSIVTDTNLNSPVNNSNAEDRLQMLADSLKKDTGIVGSHLVPLQKMAAETRTVIGIRAVDKLATQLIDDGYPTKNLHVKGKSASWGPQGRLYLFRSKIQQNS